MQIINSPLKQARKTQGLTLRALAKMAGSSASHLSNVETMKQNASKELAEKLAGLLGITEAQVLYPERFIQKK